MNVATRGRRRLDSVPRLSAGAALGCAVLLALAGCGSSAEQEPTGSETGSAHITAGVFPLLQSAIAFHAAETGLFDNAGLDVEIVQTAGGAQTVPAMLTGDYDVIYANYTTGILAAQQGLPIRIFCGNDVGADDHALVVDENSSLQQLPDLAGARIAVNNLQNIGTVAINAILADAGVDLSAIKFLELPFPDMQAALDAGDVDAIWQVEPFKASALAAGNRELSPLFVGPVEGMPVAGWLTTQQFAQENPDALATFCDALATSVEQLQGNRERLVQLVPTFTKVPAEVVQQVSLPQWDAVVSTDRLQAMADLMLDYRIIDEPFDVRSIVVSHA